jgi:glycosyltransferase involved in cell wall biosynthesis
MAQYADVCRGAKTILVEHDITFDLQRQLLDAALVDTALPDKTTPDKTTPDKTAPGGVARLEQERQLAKWREFETAAWSKVDCVVTMSQQDSRTITGARSVECIPNGVDCARFQPGNATPEPRRLLLIGSFAHLPNLLALEFFLREVWPRLSKGYSLHVIGGSRHEYYLDYFRQRMASDLTRDLAQAGVEVEGFVADVRGAYDRAALVVAPLTASAGTNIKVLEAMAMGKAVISTSAGVNGLDVTAGQDFLLADTGERMAELIEQMVDDDAGRRVIGKNARLTALRYDWVAIGKRQHALHARLLEARQTEVHLTEVHLTEVRQTEAGRLPGSLRDIQ